jgi:hypothetical protein
MRDSTGRRIGRRASVGLVVLVVCLVSTAAGAAAPTSRLAAARLNRNQAGAQSQIKTQIVGLVDKGSEGPYHQGVPFPTADPDEIAPDASAFSGVVVNESWAQLETARGHYTFGPLNKSLDAVEAYNRGHPHHALRVKLRIWGGFSAPEWAKTIAGPEVIFNTPTVHGQTTGEWWKHAYGVAWSDFQHALAAKYDPDPLIGSVAVTSCATLTAEPFTFSPSPVLTAELLGDGWSSAAQEECLSNAFSDYAGWQDTPIDYAVNAFSALAPGARFYHPDPTFSDEILTRCATLRSQVHRSCILSNHALTAGSGSATSRQASVYETIQTLYRREHGKIAVDFQTNSPDNFGGCQAIDIAVAHHAESVELWPASPIFAGFSAYTPSTLYGWARALRDHQRIDC